MTANSRGFPPLRPAMARAGFLVGAIFALQAALASSEILAPVFLLAVLAGLCIAVVCLLLALPACARRHRGLAGLRVATAAALLLAASQAMLAGDLLHLACNEADYRRTIAALRPDADGFRYKVFEWGGFMLNPVFLIYDESDQLAAPASPRARGWTGSGGEEGSGCKGGIRPLYGHFYVVRQAC